MTRSSYRDVPKMIGAHVPKRPCNRRPRPRLCVSAQMVNEAYDTWAQRQGRTQFARPRDNLCA